MNPERFVEKQLAAFVANLDPAGRQHLETMLTPSARERLRLPAASQRTRQRDDLTRWLVSERWPKASTRAQARELHAALSRYAAAGWLRYAAAGTRPLLDPERSLHRLLDLTSGDVMSEGSIRRILS